MIALKPMTANHFEQWQSQLWVRYRDDLVSAGASPAEADAHVTGSRDALMPNGALAEGHHAFSVMNDDAVIGCLWLAERAPSEWYVYDVEIWPEHRGQGFGRAAMTAGEEFVRSLGGTKIGLNVFGFNESAQNLYRSLGYSVSAMNMSKTLI